MLDSPFSGGDGQVQAPIAHLILGQCQDLGLHWSTYTCSHPQTQTILSTIPVVALSVLAPAFLIDHS